MGTFDYILMGIQAVFQGPALFSILGRLNFSHACDDLWPAS